MPGAATILSVLIASAALVPAAHAVLDPPEAPGQPFTFSTGIFEIPPEATDRGGLKRFLILGGGSVPQLPGGAGPLLSASSPDGFFAVAVLSEKQIPAIRSQGYHVIEDLRLEFDDAVEQSRIGQITGAYRVHSEYNYTGDGITVAVVDTGVDFSNLDIRGSLARDEHGHPVMLDADGQGIVLTNATFFAFIDRDGIIRNYTRALPENITSSVYRTDDGVYLDIVQGGNGTKIDIYNSFFPLAGSDPVFEGVLSKDMKIGKSHRDYIPSKSGVYHLGLIYQGALSGIYPRIQVVPVLLTDPNIAGVYDTVTPDLSTSWEDYTRHELTTEPEYDFDFTDEKPIVLGSGNEFLVYDSDGDGMADYSAGAVGARVLDVYGAVQNRTAATEDGIGAVNGTLLAPIDPDGAYFGVMSDFAGHGTASAASIASRGLQEYDIYNDTRKFTIRGVAPDAKIIPVKSLWFGDVAYSWLWAAGFDNDDVQWRFSGSPRADIISNSWGVSHFPNVGAAPGLDILSLIMGVLSVPHSVDDDYPGTVMVTSAGNSGPGYGTMGIPNVAPYGIAVGATTSNVFVGYGPFKDQPRFGSTADHHSHVVDFSSRGPGIIGDPKPDIMSVGAHGFVPSNVLRLEKNSTKESFSMFGGTSMAAPLVAGGAAVLMQGMMEGQHEVNPFAVKNILMSTATDLQNDALTQGAGLLNINNAIKYVDGRDVFLVHNDASYENIRSAIECPVSRINSTALNLERFSLPNRSYPMTGWFGGHLAPGERTTATFTVENPTDSEMEISASSEHLQLIQQTSYEGTTVPLLQDRILNEEGTYRPNYIPLHDIRNFTDLGSFYGGEATIPEDSDLLILNLNFPFDEFMNETSDIYADDLRISSLYIYDWADQNNDTQVTSDELSMVTRGGSWGTVQELRVSDPSSRFEETPLVGIYPVPTKFSFWAGDSKVNATSMNYTLTSSYYQQKPWEPVWIDRGTVTVPPNDSAKVDITIVVPADHRTGVYQGFLKFSGKHHQSSVPVSFVVKEAVRAESNILIPGIQSNSTLHEPGFLKGAFDMTNRYMAGDWRQYYFDVADPALDTAAIEFSWNHEDTNLAVFAVDPEGRIIQTNMPSGVFGDFMGWPSLDWLGTSPFSQGGGFYPVKNKDDTSTVLHVPLNQTGTYGLLVHSTLFGGNSTTEPVTMSAKFVGIDGGRQSEDGSAAQSCNLP